MGDGFDSWLSVKLKALNTDENVFGFYIKGILEGEETQDEKIEALEGILGEISPTDGATQSDICREILSHWEEFQTAALDRKLTSEVDVESKIAKIMEQQAVSVVQQKTYTEEEKKLRKTILSQYAEVSEGDEEDNDDEDEDSGEDRGMGLSRNTNAEEVMKADRAKKEGLRQEAAKKKEKDKADREKQKQQREERKEKEKKRTMKGEKKR